MKELRTEITINANRDKVWRVLMNFEEYPKWNPFIKYLQGNVAVGEKVQVYLISPGSKKGTVMRPTILKVQENNEFSWLGNIFIPGLFDGEHIFELIDNKNGTTKFIHREKISGILVPLLKKMFYNNAKTGFESMYVKVIKTNK